MTKSMGYGDSEVACENSSKIEPKHQWFMDGTEPELYPNKKQVVEVPLQSPFSGSLNSDICFWGNSSGIFPAMSSYSEHFFNPENARTVNFDEMNVQFVGTCHESMDREVIDENYKPMGFSYNRECSKTIPVDDDYITAVNNYMPMGQSYNKMDNPSMSMGYSSRKCNNVVSVNLSSSKEDDNNKSLGSSLQDSDVTISMDQSFSRGDDAVLAMAQNFIRYQDHSNVSMNTSYSKVDQRAFSVGPAFSTGQSFVKKESNIISFGGYDDDGISSSGRLMCSDDLLMGRSLAQVQTLSEKSWVKSNIETVAGVAKMTSAGSVLGPKSKETQNGPRKVHPKYFPLNVRSLLSTGMLEGVPVKYIAWSRKKELHGIIRSCGYLCGCQSCNLSKAINAFEFERHAGCKTKHPNNHIYFESRKTIYGVVQELRNTPQHLLFKVMQTITGSPINQEAFQLWRDSFQAATCKLQHIYGEDEGEQFP